MSRYTVYMETQTIDELLLYLATSGQFDLLKSVQDKMLFNDNPFSMQNSILDASYANGALAPTLEQQINSPDFSYWAALASLTAEQGFWPSTVLEEINEGTEIIIEGV